jgi:outer membrane protein assembly factor BamB
MKNAIPMTGMLVGCVMLLSANGVWGQDWPQWRGPNRDNKVTGFTEPKTWPKDLTQKWKTKVGLGDASPVLVGDKIYVFTRDGGDEVILCLDAGKGTEVWRDKYAAAPAMVPRGGHTGPRSSPVVADGKVCTLGVGGILSCLDAEKGKVVWRKDSKVKPQFYTASSPLILDGKCIAFLGGRAKGEIVAYDLASGDEKWKWSGDGPSYGSPVLMTVEKAKQLLTLTEKGLVGIGVADGKLLWQAEYSAQYNSGTPIVDGQTVICSGPADMRGRAKGGTVAFKIEKKDDGFAAKELWKQEKSPAGIYNTPVLKDGLLFGLTSPGQAPTNIFCMDAQTGDVLWTDTAKRGECGAILDAGSVLLGLTSDSELVAFKPSKKEYAELAKYKVAEKEGLDGTWACPIIAGNRVFVKDKETVTLWTIE